MYKLVALYIINIKVRLTIKKKSKKYKYYSTHQYQNDKKARMKQNKTKK